MTVAPTNEAALQPGGSEMLAEDTERLVADSVTGGSASVAVVPLKAPMVDPGVA